MMVCQSCYDVEEQEFLVRKEDEMQENDLLNEDIGYIGSNEVEGIEVQAAMTVICEEEENLVSAFAESSSSNSTAEDLSENNQPTSVRNAVSIVIKKSSSQEQRCGKCEKKMANGVRCSDCGKEVHWRCGGVTEDNEKAKIIKSNCWSCIECRSPVVECNLCKSKAKEIKNLKTNNTELSKKLDRIKYDLKQCEERCIDLEDRLTQEKKLRRRVERDLDELQRDGYSSCYSSDYEHDRRREKRSHRSSKRKSEHGSGSRKEAAKENGVSQGVATLRERQRVHMTNAAPTGPTPLEPEVIILNGESAGNGKAETLKRDKVASREPSRISTSDNEAPPINPSLQLAMQYLEKYDNVKDCDLRGRPVSGMESEEDANLECSVLEQKDEINPFSNRNKAGAHLRGQTRNIGATGICYEFQKNGACMRRNCKYIHFNRSAAYPTLGPNKGESSKTSARPRPWPKIGSEPRTEFCRDKVKNKICYNYRDRGYCSYGSKCRFLHQEPVPLSLKNNSPSQRVRPHSFKSNVSSCHDPNNNFNVNNFSEEIKNVVNALKGIIETQRQPTSVPFTNLQGYQHQQFIPVTSQAQHMWPVTVMH